MTWRHRPLRQHPQLWPDVASIDDPFPVPIARLRKLNQVNFVDPLAIYSQHMTLYILLVGTFQFKEGLVLDVRIFDASGVCAHFVGDL